MILKKELKQAQMFGINTEVLVVTVDDMCCPELDKFITQNRSSAIMQIVYEPPAYSRFDLMEFD